MNADLFLGEWEAIRGLREELQLHLRCRGHFWFSFIIHKVGVIGAPEEPLGLGRPPGPAVLPGPSQLWDHSLAWAGGPGALTALPSVRPCLPLLSCVLLSPRIVTLSSSPVAGSTADPGRSPTGRLRALSFPTQTRLPRCRSPYRP